jgi:predicted FMN-binding regulatory protein PaiB
MCRWNIQRRRVSKGCCAATWRAPTRFGNKLQDAPPAYVQTKLRGIVGTEISIGRLAGKWKPSQNRHAADIQGVLEGLAKEVMQRRRRQP